MIDPTKLRLVRGHGVDAHNKCWMAALAAWSGEDHTDHPTCVSPVIAAFARIFNDWLTNRERERVIVPIMFLPLGTTADIDTELKRLRVVVSWARKWKAEKEGVYSSGVTKALQAIQTAMLAEEFAREGEPINTVMAPAIWAAEWAAEAAESIVVAAGTKCDTETRTKIISECVQCIREMCEIGTKQDMTPVLTEEELVMVCRGPR